MFTIELENKNDLKCHRQIGKSILVAQEKYNDDLSKYV